MANQFQLADENGAQITAANPLPVTGGSALAAEYNLVQPTYADGATVPQFEMDENGNQRVVIMNSGTANSDANPLFVRTPTQYVDVTLTLETTALDAGDVAAATQIVAACCPGNDVEAVLQSVCLVDPDDQQAACSFYFFSANVALGTEDAAPSISDGDAVNYLGHVDVATTDYKDLGGVAVALIRNIGLPVKPATGTDDIYVAMTVVATPTYAGGTATLRLGFI